MKTSKIEQEILHNYRRLSQLAHVKPEGEIIPVWGLSYNNARTSGSVNQIGVIKIGKTVIHIINEKAIQLQKKSSFITLTRALKNINTMLQNIIANINNESVVTKNFVNMYVSNDVEKLAKLTKR